MPVRYEHPSSRPNTGDLVRIVGAGCGCNDRHQTTCDLHRWVGTTTKVVRIVPPQPNMMFYQYQLDGIPDRWFEDELRVVERAT